MNRLDRFKKSTFSVAILCILLISLFFGYVSCTCSNGYVSYNCYGNILPCNGMFNLGSPTSYWDTIYVNHIVGWASPLGGNVTSIAGGTANTIPKFTSATNIENSSVTEAQVAGAVANSHTQNTDTILTTNGVIQLINAGLLKNDLKTDRWLNSDTNTFMGVGVVGDGNLAHTGGSEGYSNTAFGYHALESITSSYYNSAFGYYALKSLTTGLYNTGFGMMTLTDVTTGNYNTAVGIQALTKATGSYNTAIGLFAGSTNVVGNGNVFIGASAGENELGSNKLYIANTNDATPLIYGDFGTNDLTVNGDLGVVGVIDANSNFIINVLDPLNAQDAATKNYVDTHAGAGSGNVTTITGGTANTIPKFTSATNIENSSVTEAQVAGAVAASHAKQHSITSTLDHTSTATSGKILKADANGLPVDATNTDADVADAVTKKHSQNTDTGLGAVATKNPPIDADKSLYRDSTAGDSLVTSTWLQIKAFLKTYFDGIYAALGAGTGNVTTITGGTVNKIPKFTTASNIENSSITDSGTIVTMSTNMTMGANTINNVATPTQATDAANKSYVDSKVSTGNVTTITGGTINKIPKFSSSTNIENSSVTDSGTIVTMSTNMTMSANTINSVADPTQAQDAATKNYADTKIPKSVITEQGDILYGSAASTPAALAHGNAGDLLKSGGHAANPSYISPRDMIFTSFNSIFYKEWGSVNGWTQSSVGSGGFGYSYIFIDLSTGGTDESKSTIYMNTQLYITNSVGYLFMMAVTPYFTSSSEQHAYLGIWTNPTAPTTTEKHMGWYIHDNDVWTTTGDGATQETYDTGLGCSDINDALLYIKAGTANVKFYVNNTLVATHSTHYPTGFSGKVGFQEWTTNTSSKSMFVYPVLFARGGL